jgi:hypothetical protein
MPYDEIDIKISEDGDLVVEEREDGNTDFAFVSSDECLAQDIRNRMKSNDWWHHPIICGNIEDFKGQRNTKETGERIKNQVVYALTVDGRVGVGDLIVRPIPVNYNQIDVHIFVDTGKDEDLSLSFEIPL